MIKSNAGFMTLDFIFAIIIAFGMTAILFSMTYTLSAVEIAQYVTFSTARAHSAAHENPDKQVEMGQKKFKELLGNKAIAPLFKNGWFEIGQPDIRSGGNRKNFSAEYGSPDSRKVFVGVSVDFKVLILNLNLPILGKTSEDDDGFTTKITSLLLREVSQEECQQFMKDRFTAINNIDSRFKDYNSKQSDYHPLEDNGC